MYFSEIYSIFFQNGFFHILYLFEKREFFMPHTVFGRKKMLIGNIWT